ncbi:hypothetical protein [Alkalimarinus alittae]|uniref:Uncharacterized protein n=1 Tax=Alkalimarinus alittae TaxID=2961619 RepID=A0ABY6MX40_9ALTE|nr:hypothetical protein [Alkalimarinus alittae]UZE94394.1 hypothetical protein NKI27_09830 [Alkalimarinus alittae]
MRIKSNQLYVFQEPITAYQILETAAEILSDQYGSGNGGYAEEPPKMTNLT